MTAPAEQTSRQGARQGKPEPAALSASPLGDAHEHLCAWCTRVTPAARLAGFLRAVRKSDLTQHHSLLSYLQVLLTSNTLLYYIH